MAILFLALWINLSYRKALKAVVMIRNQRDLSCSQRRGKAKMAWKVHHNPQESSKPQNRNSKVTEREPAGKEKSSTQPNPSESSQKVKL